MCVSACVCVCGGGGGKGVFCDKQKHVGNESVDCQLLVDCSSADCCPLVGRLLVISPLSVGR